MLSRTLDDSYPDVIRRDLVTVIVARLAANAAYRYAPPFLATIARGLDVGLDELGVALAITELVGFTSPMIGRMIDRLPRRTVIVAGLVGIAGGAAIAAVSTGLAVFTIGLAVLALAKLTFDIGLGSWIADHVPYERRGRVVGVTETSWALGLLVGVTAMGVVTTVSSWRWAYVAALLAVVVMAVVVAHRLDAVEPAPGALADTVAPGSTVAGPIRPVARLPRQAWLAALAVFALMAAAQAVFVTFGPWLEERFGFGAGGLAAVAFGLGAVELVASTTSASRTDRWGKERSVIGGTAVMAAAGLALAVADDQLAVGLVLLGAFVLAFEFSIVSAIPIGGDLIPGSPSRGLGMMLACGTLGRAAMSIPATSLYERSGIPAAALLAAGAATIAGLAMMARLRAR
ncbi:MAG: MFS transporter [Actinomycetota bacterium]|nr:MFS transporter [Actinomycetota bacterium]